eukprot:61436-Rhodomonas_salina.2
MTCRSESCVFAYSAHQGLLIPRLCQAGICQHDLEVRHRWTSLCFAKSGNGGGVSASPTTSRLDGFNSEPSESLLAVGGALCFCCQRAGTVAEDGS